MTIQVYLVFILTFIIYMIGTLAYSARIVGVRTGRIAVSFAVFNVFVLIQRTANTVQAPLLAKTIENGINSGQSAGLIHIFRWVIFSITLATIAGAILMPTFIKIFNKLVISFSVYRSLPRLMMHAFSKSGIEQFKNSISIPKRENLSELKNFNKTPKKVILLNMISFSVSSISVLSALYAGCLSPDLRTTCSTLSAVINSISTIFMVMFIDPYLSMMTDDVIRGESTELEFNRYIIFIVGGLIAGSILSQFLLVPASKLIVIIARLI
ncbi:lipid II flippase Amj family protein [Clostridium kluyveri]|uniref:lipid II flippase Amj family protein n=1 Tax=Clostridium kluyveri TaxID=1534 RepID=UPI0022458CC9|nr:lipid II flippase Amj family protein [Clostridium kluyveri]UZQ52345.1 lipid II flippase Amj family protein [Clostridium kluyveri]